MATGLIVLSSLTLCLFATCVSTTSRSGNSSYAAGTLDFSASDLDASQHKAPELYSSEQPLTAATRRLAEVPVEAPTTAVAGATAEPRTYTVTLWLVPDDNPADSLVDKQHFIRSFVLSMQGWARRLGRIATSDMSDYGVQITATLHSAPGKAAEHDKGKASADTVPKEFNQVLVTPPPPPAGYTLQSLIHNLQGFGQPWKLKVGRTQRFSTSIPFVVIPLIPVTTSMNVASSSPSPSPSPIAGPSTGTEEEGTIDVAGR